MIRDLGVRLENGVYRISRAVLRRSGPVMVRAPRLGDVVRLAGVYALAAAGLVFLMPLIAGVAVACATWPIGRRRPVRAIK